MLTHGNIVSNILAVTEIIPVDKNDSVLSFLPLSHILERTAGFYSIMFIGGRITYAASIDTVGEDIKAISPTLVVAVPRFLEKIYERIHEKLSEASYFKKKLFDWSVSIGREEIGRNPGGPSGGHSRSWRYRIANQLVFSKLKEELGGRIRFIMSGGAPLPVEIAQFYHATGIPVYEGYGLTETSPVISCNTPLKLKIGSVGPPVPGVDVKIAGDGEILVRGPNVMTGYFGMEKKTDEVIRDGWFHTGDIGRIDEKGFLHITDRKKDIIITSGGKNVAPQQIEILLKRSRFIDEIVLTGNKRKHITALIVPDFDRLKKIALKDTNDFNDQDALNNNQTIRDIFEKEIRERTDTLCSYEQIKKFRLLSRKFRISGGELTPTMKVRRSLVEELYKDLIDEMYQ
jgi:long-chain acyl-CoA synthetase